MIRVQDISVECFDPEVSSTAMLVNMISIIIAGVS